MTSTQLYLPTLLPQWGIFAGVVLLTVGYVDKKNLWTLLGWIALIATSLAALYFNFFSELNVLADKDQPGSAASLLYSTGWQTAAGGFLAIAALVMFHFKMKRYPLLAVLTIIYFVLTFFLYFQVSGSSGKEVNTYPKTEQSQ